MRRFLGRNIKCFQLTRDEAECRAAEQQLIKIKNKSLRCLVFFMKSHIIC